MKNTCVLEDRFNSWQIDRKTKIIATYVLHNWGYLMIPLSHDHWHTRYDAWISLMWRCSWRENWNCNSPPWVVWYLWSYIHPFREGEGGKPQISSQSPLRLCFFRRYLTAAFNLLSLGRCSRVVRWAAQSVAMVRISVLNDALKNMYNAEKRGKRQVLIRPSSKVIIKFLSVMQRHGTSYASVEDW